MDASVYHRETRDTTELGVGLDSWDAQYLQTSPGAFHGSLTRTQAGSMTIFRSRWDRAVHYQGCVSERTACLIGISLAQTGEARWRGQPVAVDDVLLQRSGIEADYLSTPLWDVVMFAIPEAELAQQLTDITHDDPEAILHGLSLARLNPRLAAQVRQACLAYFAVAARSEAKRVPSPLPGMAYALVRLMARALVAARPAHHEKVSFSRQCQLIRKVEDYVAHHSDQPLRINQLCREMAVSERSLREAFYKVTDTSPLAYLKTRQLNRVHRILRDADRGEALIKRVAVAHGFCHLGQFSRDYNQLFGELPSHTLAKVPAA